MGVDMLADVLFFKGLIVGGTVGLIVGGFFGLLIASLCFISKRNNVDDEMNEANEKYWAIEKERTNHV